jgi:phage I-like protein
MRTALYCEIGNQAPEFIRLLPLGEVTLGDGRQPFQVTRESLEKIIEIWKFRANDMVIDYEHQTVTGQEAPAAGWVKELSINSDGLWARVIWTDRARDYIEKKEYRYFSPVVEMGEEREVTDLLHVALTNFPAISNLDPLILQHQGSQETEEEAGKRPGEKWEEGRESKGVKFKDVRGEKMIIEELRMIFGLQNDASEAQILAKATDLAKTKEEKNQVLPQEIVRLLELGEEDSTNLAVERIALLKAEADTVGALREEITTIKQEQAIQQAERLIQEALSSKKTTPAELDLANGRLRRLAQDDPDFFRELILSRQDNWAVPGPLGGESRSILSLSREECAICETFGITPEAFIKNRVNFKQGE